VALLAVFVCLVTGCKRSQGEAAKVSDSGNNLPTVAVCVPTLATPFMNGIADAIKAKFDGIANVQVSSSDSDYNLMINQIQNYAAMKVNTMFIMPNDAKVMAEVMREARKSGVKIACAGVSFGEDGTDAYDCMANVNQYLTGAYAAYMGKSWLDETYPNAAPASIETVILFNKDSEDALARTNGLLSIADPYLKNAAGDYVDSEGNVVGESGKTPNPAYSAAVKIVGQNTAVNFQDGQIAMENFLTSNPNVKLVLCYASDIAAGAAQVFADRGLTEEQLAGIAVYGADYSGSELPLIKDASLGKGVYRGTISFGSADLFGDLANITMGLFNGTLKEKVIWDPISLVQAKDGQELRIEVKNSGALAPPSK
jgi:ABC-type sugar transport system substrate-binding protein